MPLSVDGPQDQCEHHQEAEGGQTGKERGPARQWITSSERLSGSPAAGVPAAFPGRVGTAGGRIAPDRQRGPRPIDPGRLPPCPRVPLPAGQGLSICSFSRSTFSSIVSV